MSIRDAAQQALEALEAALSDDQPYIERCKQTITALRAALAEDAMQRLTDVQQEMESAVKDQATYGMSITLGGKRIDPASIYKQEVPQDHIPDANKMVDVQQEMDCYGDGNVYRGQRSKDSKTQTLTINGMPAVEGLLSKAHRTSQESRQVEPVAWITPGQDLHLVNYEGFQDWVPLYTAPPKRNPMTEQQLDEMFDQAEIAIYIADRQQKEHLEVYSFGVRDAEKWHGIGGEE